MDLLLLDLWLGLAHHGENTWCGRTVYLMAWTPKRGSGEAVLEDISMGFLLMFLGRGPLETFKNQTIAGFN